VSVSEIKETLNVAIVGGGAAGFFAALTAAEKYPGASITIFEKSHKVLSKVSISGGGRCNLTHDCQSVSELCRAYPRGGKELKKIFNRFDTRQTMQWFESRGVPLVVQDDGCVFPAAQDAQKVVDCLVRESHRLRVRVVTGCAVDGLSLSGEKWVLINREGKTVPGRFDKVLVSIGGNPRKKSLSWLESLGHITENPVPSLFSFSIASEPLHRLMGVVVSDVSVRIRGESFKAQGPLLITHWGMSGPVILKLSSFAARFLHKAGYQTEILVNWINQPNQDKVSEALSDFSLTHPEKMIAGHPLFGLPSRLWSFLIEKTGCDPALRWGSLGKKQRNRLVNALTHDLYSMDGKAAFKEEFVTCGGIRLEEVNLETLESKLCRNLYFAGEILDIDGITGGFNLQAAWATGYVAGQFHA